MASPSRWHRLYHFDAYSLAASLSERTTRRLTWIALGWVIVFTLGNSFFELQMMGIFDGSPGIAVDLPRFSTIHPVPFHSDQFGFSALLSLLVFHQVLMLLVAYFDVRILKERNGGRLPWTNIFVHTLAQVLIGGAAFFDLHVRESLINLFSLSISWLDRFEPFFNLPFLCVAIGIYVLDDVFFYMGHRLCHNVRFMWKLGHVTHHRNRQLTHFTQVADWPAFFLDGGGGSFITKIVGSAVFLKLLTNLSSERALLTALCLATLRVINHTVSHSMSAYLLFSKYPWLASLEKFFVTGRIHYIHHSALPQHNVANGCNFAAQFVWIDKLLGTFGKPTPELPPTGLFHEPDYPGNPWKYALEEWRKMVVELRRNRFSCWIPILFGPAAYEPPVSAYAPTRGAT